MRPLLSWSLIVASFLIIAPSFVFAADEGVGIAQQMAQLLLSKGPPEERIRSALVAAKKFLTHTSSSAVIHAAFKGASPKSKMKMNQWIGTVDHIGFIVPPGTEIADLERVSSHSGFPAQHRVISSVIVAKELGGLLGGEPIPTKIFICSTRDEHEKEVSVEMFVPSARPEIVEEWIRKGVGTHIALRVREQKSVDEIKNMLLTEGFSMPAFMENKSMWNPQQGSTTVYFDLLYAKRKLRIEILHKT